MAQIVGEPVEWLHGVGPLSVQIGLNTTDESAIRANKGKAPPRMLTNVTTEKGNFPNAVVVQPGSILEFRLRCTGPWGFGYRIETGNTMIVRMLFSYSTQHDMVKETSIRRYQDQAMTIRVDDWATLGMDTQEQKTASWRLDFMAWGILGFYSGGRRYGTPSPPGGLALRSHSVGATPSAPIEVRGAGVNEGGASEMEFGEVTRLNHLGPDHVKRSYLTAFLFVTDD